MLQPSSGNTRAICEISAKLTIKTPELQGDQSGVFIVNFEQVSNIKNGYKCLLGIIYYAVDTRPKLDVDKKCSY